MNAQIEIQKLLNKKLSEARSKNPSYSLRAMATRLNVGAGPLSQILGGTRSVSQKMAERFCDRLMLDPIERSLINDGFEKTKKTRKAPSNTPHILSDKEYLKVSADEFKVVSEWYYFAILSLVKTKGFKNDVPWIASRLGLSNTVARSALERLLQLKMLVLDGKGNLKRSKTRFKTTDDVINLSVRKAHFETLDLAKKSLEHDDITVRDFSTITMPTNTNKIQQAKELIRKFQEELCSLLETEAPLTF